MNPLHDLKSAAAVLGISTLTNNPEPITELAPSRSSPALTFGRAAGRIESNTASGGQETGL